MTGNASIVMIVDDDDSIRKSVRRLMKSFGFVVETFSSAEEFLGSQIPAVQSYVRAVHRGTPCQAS